MLLDWVYGLFSNDLAIDLGTANTLTFVRGKGIVSNEPSVVAVQRAGNGTKKVLAVGKEAKEMLGRTPGNIVAVRPMKDGVIADFEVTEAMLRYFITQGAQPPHAGEAAHHHRRALGHHRGREARRARLGAGRGRARGLLDRGAHGGRHRRRAARHRAVGQHDRRHRRRHDRGGRDLAGGHRRAKSIRVAGDKMDEAIVAYIKRKYNLLVGERTAEIIKKPIGNAYATDEVMTMEIKGRDLVAGVPKTLVMNSDEVREALAEPVNQIVDAVRSVLERTPPELAADIVDRGIVLDGRRRAAAQPGRHAARGDGPARHGLGLARVRGRAGHGPRARRAGPPARSRIAVGSGSRASRKSDRVRGSRAGPVIDMTATSKRLRETWSWQ